MSAFGDLRRGFRAGLRGSSAAQQNGSGLDHEEPNGFGGDELAECKAVITGLREQTASLKAQVAQLADERDRACADRDRYADSQHIPAHTRELETIIAFPGVKNALLKALHPDTGTGGDVPSRTAIFQTLMNVFGRLGLGR